MLLYKDYQRKEDTANCKCKNIKIFWKAMENNRYSHCFAIEYATERPEIFEANEKNLNEKYPCW